MDELGPWTGARPRVPWRRVRDGVVVVLGVGSGAVLTLWLLLAALESWRP